MATYNELRLQQLLSPLNNQGTNNGIMGIDQDLPLEDPFTNSISSQANSIKELANSISSEDLPLIDPFVGYDMKMNNQFDPRNFQSIFPKSGIIKQAPQGIFNDYYGPNIDTSFGVANEEDEEQEFSLKDSLSNLGRKTGISSLIGMITGNPIIGLIGKGIGALTGGSSFVGPKGSTGYGDDSAMSLFRRSNTGAQFFQGLRDKRARDDAAKRGAAKQKDLARINAMRGISGNSIPTGGGRGGNPGTTTGGSSKDSGTGGSFGTSSNNNDSFSDYS